MKIEYPSQRKIAEQIKIITKKGLVKKRSFFYYLRDIFHSVGLRVIFHGMADAVFIAMTAVLGIAVISAGIIEQHMNEIYAVSFIASPITYMLLCFFTLWKEKMSGTYEVKMACKYTVYHLTAFRMFLFSLLSMVINTCGICILCLFGGGLDFWRLFGISVCSLFLFSVILLYGLLHRGGLVVTLAVSFMWIAGNIFVSTVFREIYDRALLAAPPIIHIFVTVALMAAYGSELTKLLFGQKEGRAFLC